MARNVAPKSKAKDTMLKRKRDVEEPPKAPVKRQKKADAPSAALSGEQVLDVYVFGAGESGELGLGPAAVDGRKPTNVKYPRRNALLEPFGVVQIAAGGMHCISRTKDNEIVTWGVNDEGALGRDTNWTAPLKDIDDAASDSDDSSEEGGLNPLESTPAAMDMESFGKGAGAFRQVAATDNASFAITGDGKVYGWGTFRASDGPFGFSTIGASAYAKSKKSKARDESLKTQRQPIQIPALTKIKALATGANHVLALDDKGKVYTWGVGEQCQLGRRIVNEYSALTPCRLGLSKIKQIACGSTHSFAVNEDGLVYAWGMNSFGQTGISDGAGDDAAMIATPTIVENLRDFQIKEITGGKQHSIACTMDGKVLAWGRCDESQTGIDFSTVPEEDFKTDPRGKPGILLKPTVVPGVSGAVFVSAGIDNSIAITSDGKAYSWGYSEGYRTGLGTDDTVKVPTMIQNTAVKDKKIAFSGCGGQFSILAGLP